MVLPDDWLFEIIKLAAQFAGALIVAWLAVRWALRRYKREKSWEKRLQAYTEIVQAIGHMNNICLKHLWAIQANHEFTDEHNKELVSRYSAAKTKLEEVRAMANLLLPDSTIETLDKLFESLEAARLEAGHWEVLDAECFALSAATKEIVQQGRTALGVY